MTTIVVILAQTALIFPFFHTLTIELLNDGKVGGFNVNIISII